MASRLGIDVGGTFTDLLLLNDDTGESHLLKTPSTPDDQSLGILIGIERIIAETGVSPQAIGTLLHGTTVSTNIVLEAKGARVGLIVTENFEQVLHMARSQTPGPLAGWMIMIKPDPLADLELTRGVRERINSRGEIVTPLDEARARAAIGELADAGVESITVSLLHSYANPAHEQRVKALIAELGVEVPISLSSEILPEFREYERTLVAVMNAYVRPSMRTYLTNFEDKLRAIQFSPHVNIIRSDGGLMSVQRASDSPVHTMVSGPAGGVSGAAFVASLAGHKDALGFDMGGTSTDVSLIRDGKPTISRQTSLGYYPIKVPSVEVHSVGAGGGSIAHVPMTGALRVGPESAGAVPGPACYAKGGDRPTVTDANVVLGRLPPSLLGGEMTLDATAADEAVGKIGHRLGLDTHQAAQGILDIVNENMFGALRLLTVQKGLDPRDFALVAFGGAGPLHGNALAMLAGCYPVIVPPTPGVLSALGFLYSDVKNEFAQTFIRSLEDARPGEVNEILVRLGSEAKAWLGEEGIGERDREVLRGRCALLPPGLRVLPRGRPRRPAQRRDRRGGGALRHRARAALRLQARPPGRACQPACGRHRPGGEGQLVNLRAVGTGRVVKVEFPRFEKGDGDPSGALVERHRVYFDGTFVAASIYDRNLLAAGNRVPGPAVFFNDTATTEIYTGHLGEVDEYLNILIRPEGAGA
jgi:N-methylhydantoinase A